MTVEMIPWVISRATGFTAIIAFTLAMLAGLMIRTRTPVGEMKGAGLVDVHRLMSLIALVATVIHGTVLMFDSTLMLRPVQLFVPGLIPYRPVWTALGVIAVQVAVVVHLSFRWRGRIGVTAWRRIHLLTYFVFVLGIVHGVMAGTDTPRSWALAIYGGAVASVAAATGWRMTMSRPRKRTRKTPAPHAATISRPRPTRTAS